MRMMSELRASETYLQKIVTRNFFRKMMKMGIGTEEVVNLANRVVGKVLERRTGEIRRIMGLRLREIESDIRIARNEFFIKNKSTKELIKNPVVRKRFFMIQREMKSYVWRVFNNKWREKVHFLRKKEDRRRIERSGEEEEDSRFYKVTDDDLSHVPEGRSENNFVVYGDCTISEEEEQCLSLGPKFMVTPNLNTEDFEVELETECVKTRMELIKRDVIDQEEEDDNDRPEEDDEENIRIIDLMHKEDKRIYNETDGILDMSKMLVTDVKYNVRSFPPRQSPPEQEIKIQMRKQRILEEFKNIKSIVCDKKSDKQKRANMNEDQQKGLSSL